MGKKLDSPPVIQLQAGTNRTLFATWGKTKYEHQSGYVVKWQYDTGQGVWFDGSESTVSGTNSTYTAPDNAIKVVCRVKPNPGSKAKWSGSFTSAVYADGFPEEQKSNPESTIPAAPSSVSISIDGTAASATVTARVTNYNDDRSNGVLTIEIVQNDAAVVQSGDVTISMGVASLSWSGTNLEGCRFKARAKAHGNAAAGGDSDWSNYTENQDVSSNPVPTAPGNIDIVGDPESVTVTVTNYDDDKSDGRVRIQIIQDDYSIVHDVTVTNFLGMATTTYTGGNLRGKRFKARAQAYSNTGEEGSWSNFTPNLIIPENTTPAPPTNLSITIDDREVKVTLSGYSDDNSNGTIRFQIIENDKNVVQEGDVTIAYGVASLSYTIPTYNGSRYKARAMAYGKFGEQSPWSDPTENRYSKTAKAKDLRLTATSSTSVTAKWAALSGAETYTLEFTSTVVDGQPVFDTASSDVQTVTNIKTLYYLAQSLTTAKRWYFRVRGVNDGGEGEWSDVVNIMLGTTPDKPTIWSYTTVGKIGESIVLNWVHSSQDDSDQSGARLAIKINNGTETVITLTTQTTYTYNTSSLSDGDKINWRVSTRGIQGIPVEWGEYSEYREIVVYSPPSITFTVGAPDETEIYPVVGSFPIEISGSSLPLTQTPVAYAVSIFSESQYDVSEEDGIEVHVTAGQEIYSTYIPSTSHTLSLTLNPGDLYLVQGVVYRVTAMVAMTNGLTAEYEREFKAKWDIPSWSPDAEVTVDKTTLVAYIRPFCADQWHFEIRRGFHLAVFRIDYDGQLTKIASGIDPADSLTITDLHPSLDYARYRIVATDNSTGVVFYNDLEGIPVRSKAAVIQWEGEARAVNVETDQVDYIINDWCGTILKLPYNIEVNDDIEPDVSLVEYIGRKHPVSYYGTQQGATSRWTTDIPKWDTESIAKVRALAIYPGDVYVREPSGTGYWANVKVSYSMPNDKTTAKVTFTISRVEGGA